MLHRGVPLASLSIYTVDYKRTGTEKFNKTEQNGDENEQGLSENVGNYFFELCYLQVFISCSWRSCVSCRWEWQLSLYIFTPTPLPFTRSKCLTWWAVQPQLVFRRAFLRVQGIAIGEPAYVCLLSHLKNHMSKLHDVSVHVVRSLTDDSATRCTSGFVHNVMFTRNQTGIDCCTISSLMRAKLNK